MTKTAATEEIRRRLEAIRDETGLYANTATRIGNAFLSLLNYLCDAPFLRKDSDDATAYLLTLLAGCVIGESNNITLKPDGSIHCGSITVDGSALFNEIIINHQNVLEGDTYFTDKGIIESVEHTDLRQYKLTFRKEYEEDRVTFHTNDILLGKVNNLDRAKTFNAIWLRIDTIDTEANTAVCTLYDDNDVPGGSNFAPVAAVRVIRWGNTVDKARQNVWFVSSTEGRWLFLQGVDKPILEDSENGSNYSAFIGLPPDIQAVRELLRNKVLSKDQPATYMKTLITENLIMVDHLGKPVYQARDCGRWSSSRTYIHGWDSEAQGYYSDRVWHGGCYWQCSVASTTSEPRYGNADWTCLIGGENMDIDIESSNGNFFRVRKTWTTVLTATVWNAEMKLTADDLKDCSVVWTRESDEPDGDTAWNAAKKNFHEYALPVSSSEDTPSQWKAGSKVGFRCTVNFPDPGSEPLEASYTIVN